MGNPFGAVAGVKGLLGDNLVGGSEESHAVSLNEGLSVFSQSIEKGLEVAGEDAEANEGVDDFSEELVEGISTINELVLVSVDGGVLAEENLESDLLEILDHFLGVDGHDSSNKGLHTVHDINMAHVRGIIVLQREPIEEGHFSSRLEDTVELLEESLTILSVGEHLNLVKTIEVLVLEGEGVVVVSDLEGKTISVSGLLGITLGNFDLVLVDVDTGDLSSSNSAHVVGNTTTATPDIKDMSIGLEVQITGHLPLEENLVLKDGTVQVHDGRNVHLLDFTNSAQLVDNSIVVLDVPLVVNGFSDHLLIEKFIRLHERVNGRLREEVKSLQGKARSGDTIVEQAQVGHNGAEKDEKDEAKKEPSSHSDRVHVHNDSLKDTLQQHSGKRRGVGGGVGYAPKVAKRT